MTLPRLRFLVIGLVLLLGGFVLGLWVGWQQGASTMSWLGAVGQDHIISELAYTQYQQGGYAAAKESLEEHLAYLEQLLPHGERWEEGQSPFLN